MTHAVDDLRRITAETRQEFVDGTISPASLLRILDIHRPGLIGIAAASLHLSALEDIVAYFPRSSCDAASALLKERVGHGDIVLGSYGTKDGGYYDLKDRRYVVGHQNLGDRYHSFLDVGETALGAETILDITADQFGGPEIYVGPLGAPWSRSQDWGVGAGQR